METSTWLGLGALLVSAAGALNSLRKTGIDDRSATHAELQALNKNYRDEIERLKVETRESEDECRRQIKECKDQNVALQGQIQEMRQTIVSQANQIGQLERRKALRTEGDR